MSSAHLGATLAEQHDQSQVSCSRWEAEGTHAIFRHHVYTGPKLQKERSDFLVAEVALDTEHRRIVEDFGAIIHVGPGQHQQTAHLSAQTKRTLQSIPNNTPECLLLGYFGPSSNSETPGCISIPPTRAYISSASSGEGQTPNEVVAFCWKPLLSPLFSFMMRKSIIQLSQTGPNKCLTTGN